MWAARRRQALPEFFSHFPLDASGKSLLGGGSYSVSGSEKGQRAGAERFLNENQRVVAVLAGSESTGGNLKTPRPTMYGFRLRNSCHVAVRTENSRTSKPVGLKFFPWKHPQFHVALESEWSLFRCGL